MAYFLKFAELRHCRSDMSRVVDGESGQLDGAYPMMTTTVELGYMSEDCHVDIDRMEMEVRGGKDDGDAGQEKADVAGLALPCSKWS